MSYRNSMLRHLMEVVDHLKGKSFSTKIMKGNPFTSVALSLYPELFPLLI